MALVSLGGRRRGVRAPSRVWWILFAALPAAIIGTVAGARLADRALPPDTAMPDVSTVVVGREGGLLRAFTVDDGRWRLPVALHDVDPTFLRLLVAYEDQRFATHAGVDPLAMARAAGQALTAGRIVSGGSTLTMQTVRLLTEQRARTGERKLIEILRAMQLERHLTKDEILTRYLHTAPYGGNIEGVRAASLAYFAREPARLTLAQAALLIALPQSPEARRPDRHPQRARKARDRVLAVLAARGAITKAEAARASREAVPVRRRAVPLHAPHLARRLAGEDPAARVHRTTLRTDWQAALEDLAAKRVDLIGPRVSAAILVADHATGEILASVGAARFLDPRRAGHVDMTLAVRSPGSTLKPVIYGLGIEAGLVARGTLMDDAPTLFAGYEPENFDEDFRGMVSVEEALQSSLNVPAVTLLDALGPTRLAVRLEASGAKVDLPDGVRPTLAIGLGGLGTRLADLAMLYGALAREGVARPLSTTGPTLPQGRLLSARAARAVTAMLSGMRPPRNAPRAQIAYKTGTSYGHRDAFAIGYDGRHVIAVWVGRPDGTPVPQLTGWSDAAPILFDAFARIGPVLLPAQPVAVPTAELPPPLRAFTPWRRAGASRGDVSIAFPPDGAVVALQEAEGARKALVARVVGTPVDTWLLNGRPLPVRPNRRQASFDVAPGRHTLTVVTREGQSQRVDFTAQ